jgi:hypothetical protein
MGRRQLRGVIGILTWEVLLAVIIGRRGNTGHCDPSNAEEDLRTSYRITLQGSVSTQSTCPI